MKNMFHELLSYCYFSVLKPLGWKKEGNNFRHYDNDGLCKIINFQKSRWNTGQECEFYINMGVYIEKAREIEKKKFHEYECQFRNRASSKGGTYRLNDTVDLSIFQEEIAGIITDEVLVLLNNFDSKEKFIKMLLSGAAQQYTDVPVMHYDTCKLLCDMGFKKEILNILKDKKGKLFDMNHDINLNIHYNAPKEIWKKIGSVYERMPYWAGHENEPHWIGKNIDLWASVEPGGIQIAGIMPDDIWEEWYHLLKKRLTEVLGYEIGEPEDGYDFKYFD